MAHEAVKRIAHASMPALDSPVSFDRRFLIRVNPEELHLVIEMSGMWTKDDLIRYRHDLREASLDGIRRGDFRGSLLDASRLHLQAADVADEHARFLNIARRMFGVRASVLMTGPRCKLQMRRLAVDTGHRFFTDRGEALDWLYD
jgi:hypothetical protein